MAARGGGGGRGERGEDGIAEVAGAGNRAARGGAVAVDGVGDAGERQAPARCEAELAEEVARGEVGASEDLVGALQGAGQEAVLHGHVPPVLARLRLHGLAEQAHDLVKVQGLAVGRAQLGPCGEFQRVHGDGELVPLRRAHPAQVEIAVAGFEQLPLPAGLDRAGVLVVRVVEEEGRGDGLLHAHVDVLPDAGAAGVAPRRQGAGRRRGPAPDAHDVAGVGDRFAIVGAVEVDHAAAGADGEFRDPPVAAGTGLPVAGDGDVDHGGAGGEHVAGAEAVACEDARRFVLDDDVGPAQQLPQAARAVGLGVVEHDRLLAGVAEGEGRARAVIDGRSLEAQRIAAGRLHPHDARAGVEQQLGAVRPGDARPQVQHPQPVKHVEHASPPLVDPASPAEGV